MQPAHVHLLTNHVPILGAAFVLLLLAWGWLRGSREVLRAALAATVLVGAFGYVAKATGERAEEEVEELAWASDERIHAHEEAGELATNVGLAAAALAGVALLLTRGERRAPGWALGATSLALLATAVLMARTGLLGGDIRHDELRGGSATPTASAEPGR